MKLFIMPIDMTKQLHVRGVVVEIRNAVLITDE